METEGRELCSSSLRFSGVESFLGLQLLTEKSQRQKLAVFQSVWASDWWECKTCGCWVAKLLFLVENNELSWGWVVGTQKLVAEGRKIGIQP